MKSPGIQVRPLVNMAGSHEFNEVFFEDLRIPRDQLVGEMNRGWYVGMATMDFERSAIGGVAGNRRDLEDIVAEVKSRGENVTPTTRMEVIDRRVEVDVTRMLSQRIISIQESGNVPNYEASIAKLFTSELNQRMARTAMHVLGLDGQAPRNAVQARWMQTYSRSVSATIAGGTSEIQRNIVATRGLGLPRG